MTWMIEATSQFEIPRPFLRSSVWPRQVSSTAETPSCQYFAPRNMGS